MRSAPAFCLALALLARGGVAQVVMVSEPGPPGGSTDAVVVTASHVVMVQDGRYFRSSDGGRTWAASFGTFRSDYGRQRLRVGSDGAVYASAYDGAAPQGLRTLRSTDGGATWDDVSNADLRSAFALRTARHGWFSPADRPNYVLRSTDQGRTWVPARNGLENLDGHQYARGSEVVEAPDGTVLLVVEESWYIYGARGGVFVWNPDELRWERRVQLLGAPGDVALAPNGVGAVAAFEAGDYSQSGLFVTRDGGRSWEEKTNAPRLPGYEALAVGPDGRVYAGGQRGVAATSDGITWTPLGLGGVHVTDLAFGADGALYAASGSPTFALGNPPGQGLFRRVADTTWALTYPDASTSPVTALAEGGRVAATAQGVWERKPEGWAPATFEEIAFLPYPGSASVLGDLVTAPWGTRYALRLPILVPVATKTEGAAGGRLIAMGTGTLLALGHDGLQRSTDRGRSWQRADTLGVAAFAARGDGRLYAVGTAVWPPAPRLWTSTDSGATWRRLPVPPVSGGLSAIAVREEGRTLYVGYGARLFRSDNEGATWSEVPGASLYGGYGARLAVLADGRMLVGGRYDLALSEDEGRTWTTLAQTSHPRFVEGWAFPVVFDPAGRLVTTAAEAGLLRSALPVAVPPEIVPGAALRAAPNPFRDAVTAALDLPTPGPVRAEVFDGLGRRVAILHDGPAAGPLALRWDGAGAAPGVYLLRVAAPDGVRTARLVRVR